MDFKELVNIRYSVRKYSNKAIDSKTLECILESARKAPSAVNLQPYKIYVIQSDSMLKKIKDCYHRDWFKLAPLVLVITGLHNEAWKRKADNKDHTDIDAAILIDHITLQAADLGLGSCWVCNFDTRAVSNLLELNSNEEPIALLPLGYPNDDNIPSKKRKEINDIVIWK
jgi:nitroreductase